MSKTKRCELTNTAPPPFYFLPLNDPGNISPIDVLTHLPIMCEDRDVPYIYVPSKEELGVACMTKRPTSCMLILPKPAKGSGDDDKDFKSSYDDVSRKVKALQPVF